jgi:hypothetical protein
VSRVTRRFIPVIADSNRKNSSSASARLASSRCTVAYRSASPSRCERTMQMTFEEVS